MIRMLLIASLLCASADRVSAQSLNPAFSEPLVGPSNAKGVAVWSHGRSITTEDSKSPTPAYLRALKEDGWDVLRYDRLSHGDTLTNSSKKLIEHTVALKKKGYKQVILAGQSFGAFLALRAAGESGDVDAVVATAPAAYGSFDEFYDSWRLNATRLYPLLEHVRRARIMVFYFHGDDFDPGARGDESKRILEKRGLGYAVVDQPAYLTTHWAASSGLFLRRFGDCIRDFANDTKLKGRKECVPRWGILPSRELKLPEDIDPKTFRDLWYGFYPNGREVFLGIESTAGDQLTAIYSVGPSIDSKHDAIWTRRTGRVSDKGFMFVESGKSTLQFRSRQDGGLSVSWTSADGTTSMMGSLKLIDPSILIAPEKTPTANAPVALAAQTKQGSE